LLLLLLLQLLLLLLLLQLLLLLLALPELDQLCALVLHVQLLLGELPP
jgi:hypothetical protein